jgi:hypothetical protein
MTSTSTTYQSTATAPNIDDHNFDSKVRENYMVFIYLVICCLIATWSTIRSSVIAPNVLLRIVLLPVHFNINKKQEPSNSSSSISNNIEQQQQPLISTLFTLLALGFSIGSIIAIPITHVLLTFPTIPTYLEVNAIRLSTLTWTCTTIGSLIGLFFLVPFSFLYGQSAGTTWRSKTISTFIELLLLMCLIGMAALLMIRRNLLQEIDEFSILLIKQAVGVVVLLPGMVYFLYAGPAGMITMIHQCKDALLPMSSTQRSLLESKLLLLQLGMIRSEEEQHEIRMLEMKFAQYSTMSSLILAIIQLCCVMICCVSVILLAIIGPWNLPVNSHNTFRVSFLVLQLFYAKAMYHGSFKSIFKGGLSNNNLLQGSKNSNKISHHHHHQGTFIFSTLFLLVFGLTSPLALFSLGIVSFDSVSTLCYHLSITYLLNGSSPIPVRVFDGIFAYRLVMGVIGEMMEGDQQEKQGEQPSEQVKGEFSNNGNGNYYHIKE